MWTNTSLPPSWGTMKPKPFVALNHFTVPIAMRRTLLSTRHGRRSPARDNRAVERLEGAQRLSGEARQGEPRRLAAPWAQIGRVKSIAWRSRKGKGAALADRPLPELRSRSDQKS